VKLGVGGGRGRADCRYAAAARWAGYSGVWLAEGLGTLGDLAA
jgi:hypothetical protein